LLFDLQWVGWVGAFACVFALVLMPWSLVSFGRSFRIGIDAERPDKLVTTGIFALTRNPIYVAFGLVLLGEFLILPTWVRLIYVLAGFALLHRQVMREEAYLTSHYGDEYRTYCTHVRRYL
jgi:protein-S-isoprenylcysteine O-methyltransferase Ste14